MSNQLITVLSTAVVKSLTSSLPVAVNKQYNIDPASFTSFLGDFLKEQLTATGAKKRKNLGRVSGYNLFSQHLHQQDKANGFKEAGEQWKAMTDAQRAAWNDKAVQHNNAHQPAQDVPAAEPTKKKRVGHVSGYNLFLRNRRTQDKSRSMKDIGEEWRSLSDAQKAEWNSKGHSSVPTPVAAVDEASEEDSEATQPPPAQRRRLTVEEEEADSEATQPQTQPTFHEPMEITQTQNATQYESAEEELRPVKKEPVTATAQKEKKPTAAPKKQPQSAGTEMSVKRDASNGKWMVVGTNLVAKSHKNKVIIGKMIDGVERPLDFPDRALCQQRGWAVGN